MYIPTKHPFLADSIREQFSDWLCTWEQNKHEARVMWPEDDYVVEHYRMCDSEDSRGRGLCSSVYAMGGWPRGTLGFNRVWGAQVISDYDTPIGPNFFCACQGSLDLLTRTHQPLLLLILTRTYKRIPVILLDKDKRYNQDKCCGHIDVSHL